MTLKILDMVEVILQQANKPLSLAQIKQETSLQFQEQIDRLGTLISLDQRFYRSDTGEWALQVGAARQEDPVAMLQQALELQEKAYGLLNQEKERLEKRRETILARKLAIEQQVIRLGGSIQSAKAR